MSLYHDTITVKDSIFGLVPNMFMIILLDLQDV